MDFLDDTIDKFENNRSQVQIIRDILLQSFPTWNRNDEIRINVFGQILNILTSYNISLTLVRSNYVNPERLVALLSLTSLPDARAINFNLHTFYRNAYIYNLSAIVEGFSRAIAMGVGIDNKKDYYYMMDDIFGLMKIKKESEWDAIMILSNIRNGMHNNGVHASKSNNSNKQNRLIAYRRNNIGFYNGMPIGGISDDLLALITGDIISYLRIIVQHAKIAAIPYVRDMAVIADL